MQSYRAIDGARVMALKPSAILMVAGWYPITHYEARNGLAQVQAAGVAVMIRLTREEYEALPRVDLHLGDDF